MVGDDQGFARIARLVHLVPDFLDQVVILDGLQQFLAVRVYEFWHFGRRLVLLLSLLPDKLSLFLKCQLLVLIIIITNMLEARLAGKVASRRRSPLLAADDRDFPGAHKASIQIVHLHLCV